MHIIKWELKAHMKSLLIWCAIMIFIIFMMFSEFAAYYNNPEMADIMDSMPETMLKAFSMDNANLTTTTGYLSILSIYFNIMLGVFAVLLGSSIIAKEERDKTAEYLMTLPVSREKIIFSKLITALINCFILLIVTSLSCIGALYKYDLDSAFYKYLFLLTCTFFIVMLIFLSLGMFLSSVLKRYKSSGMISTSVLLVLYFLNVLSALSKNLDFLKYITPFKYFEPNSILQTSQIELKFVLISIALIIFGIVGTFIIYPRRDLHI